MFYVYMLKSIDSEWRYTGSTNDLRERLKKHNEGEVQSTKHFAPFKLEAYVAVNSEVKARALEQYFKTGSGAAIMKKRILQVPE
ncbi:MAG: GIY-YIG nuclease family protein [Balneolaceae bacterium]|nr:GIY-YIG nuclease family protein [Balneolaceae bacterium]